MTPGFLDRRVRARAGSRGAEVEGSTDEGLLRPVVQVSLDPVAFAVGPLHRAALAGLRDLVHGPVPEVLLYEGLRAAVEDLAGDAPSTVTAAVHGDQEPPPEVAVAAYLCIAALIEQGSPQPCAVDVDITEAGTRVLVRSGSDPGKALDQDLLDRIGALAGKATVDKDGHEWSVEVWLPCAS